MSHIQRIARLALLLLLAGSAGACSSISKSNFLGANSDFPAAGDLQADTALSRGKLHFKNGNFGLAERHYRLAAEQTPRELDAWIGLAASYDQLKRFDLADRAYEQALKLSGDSAVIHNNIGFSHLLRGDPKKAGSHFHKALAKAPDNARIKGNVMLARELAQQGSAKRARTAKL